jgi:hypothetical protein
MRKLTCAGVLVAFLLPQTALAWNDAGHMTAAAVAYLSLSPEVRAKVDALLRQHPAFPRFAAGLSHSAPDFGAVVFMRAAIWPDQIRSDSRFFDDTDANATPTPLLPGFPDMKIHRPWHFIDEPFTFEGTPTAEPESPNALTQILEFRSALGDDSVDENIQAYDLSWLIHLVGDIHQPLHAAARFSALHDQGDRGGNQFRLGPPEKNLHSFWDGSLSKDNNPQRLLALAKSLLKEFKPDAGEIEIADDEQAEETVTRWIDESATLARYVVYTVGTETAAPPNPKASSAYRSLARKIARHRIAVAGYRLGSIISDRLE